MTTVYQTLTEHTNGRRKDDASPTGWVRRAGSERVPHPNPRKQPFNRPIWEPCDPPIVARVGTPEERDLRGGTLDTHIEDLPDVLPIDLPAFDQEVLIRYHLHRYTLARYVCMGGVVAGGGPEKADAPDQMIDARSALERLGVDVGKLDLR